MIGLTSVLALAGDSVVRALASLLTGMLLATVGVDDVYGTVRFDFGSSILRDGVDYLPVMVGIYALGHVLVRFGERFQGDVGKQPSKVRTTLPGLRALKERAGSLLRGTALGSVCGVVPGAGATVASFLAYGVEKQAGKDRDQVGKGSPNGVIAPQAASTATVGGHFTVLLVLGIPGSAASAVILGALLIHNVQARAADLRPAARPHLHDHRRAARQRGADGRHRCARHQADDPHAQRAGAVRGRDHRAVRLHRRVRDPQLAQRRVDHDVVRGARLSDADGRGTRSPRWCSAPSSGRCSSATS